MARLFFSGQSRFPDSGGAGVSVAFAMALIITINYILLTENMRGLDKKSLRVE